MDRMQFVFNGGNAPLALTIMPNHTLKYVLPSASTGHGYLEVRPETPADTERLPRSVSPSTLCSILKGLENTHHMLRC